MKPPKRGKKTESALEELYRVLLENDYPKVLALGQAQLATAPDKLAVLEAMIDAIENLLYDGDVKEPGPLKELEKALGAERQRLKDAGATSDVYKTFLDRTYKGGE